MCIRLYLKDPYKHDVWFFYAIHLLWSYLPVFNGVDTTLQHQYPQVSINQQDSRLNQTRISSSTSYRVSTDNKTLNYLFPFQQSKSVSLYYNI